MYGFAKENNVCVHTDGARVMNAAVSLGVPVSEIMKYSDSVNMCFSKVKLWLCYMCCIVGKEPL